MNDPIGVTEIVSEPEFTDAGDGFMAYRAEGLFGPHRRPVRVIALPLADGDWSLLQRGDRVLCALSAGVAYVIRGPLVTASEDASAAVGQYRYIQTPVIREGAVAKSTPGVRVGGRSGGAWEQVMLHATAAKEIVNLKTQIDALAAYLVTAVTPTAGAALAPLATEKVDAKAISITGGKAAFGLYSRSSEGAKS